MKGNTIRKAMSVLLALAFILLAGAALADTVAVIDAGHSTKVHLRAEPSYNSESMGLFFTGTEVDVLSEQNGWTRVTIGVDTGYIDSRYLRMGQEADYVQSRQPAGYVTAKNYANVRLGPSTEYMLLDTPRRNARLTVMGETDEHWYYVDTGKAMGYIAVNLVHLNSPKLPALQEGYAVIDAGGSSKLHLRSDPSTGSDSLGLYFTGTQVYVAGYSGEWTRVGIGTEAGYMLSRYLKTGDAASRVRSKQPTGWITARNGANVRSGPSEGFEIIALAERNSTVLILGETYDHWYYVNAGGKTGYVSARLVSLEEPDREPAYRPTPPTRPARTTPPSRPVNPSRPTRPTRPTRPIYPQNPAYNTALPGELPYTWYFSSGAGTWATELNLRADGTFSGRYDDSDMGSRMHYEAVFSGRFTDIRQTDGYTITMTLSELNVEGILGDSYWLDGMRHIVSVPAGLQQGETFTLYMPGADMRGWSENKKFWTHNQNLTTLSEYYLYGERSQSGFVPGGL